MSDKDLPGSPSDEAREIFGHAPPPEPPSDAPPSDARLRGVPNERLGAGYDLEGETAYDVAPVGPTELRADDASAAPPSARSPSSRRPTVGELEQQIQELESRLDAMMQQPGARPAVERAPRATSASGEREPDGAEAAREILASDYYLRHWGRAGMRSRAEEVDEFGLDPDYEARLAPAIDFLYRTYFRVDVRGAGSIPSEGRALVVANHSGGPLPYDGLILRAAIRREAGAPARDVRWLAEDFLYYLPFVGTAMNRLGAVRACQENAERLLAHEKVVAVFPEGAKGTGKLYRERYKLQRFGRGGFVRLALRTRAPVVPCAIVGAEEANPILARFEILAKTLGLPYLPVTPTFPALGPLGLLPAPTKWRIELGEPLDFREYGPEAAEDELLVGRLAERVRASIQAMLDRAVAARKSVWWG